jgi:hypothetical protein
MCSDRPFEEGDTHEIVSTMFKFTAYQSLVVCDVECFSPAICMHIITHLEKDAILAIESDLTYVVFFFYKDNINLADMTFLVEVEKFIARIISTSLTSLAIVESHFNCMNVIPVSSNL